MIRVTFFPNRKAKKRGSSGKTPLKSIGGRFFSRKLTAFLLAALLAAGSFFAAKGRVVKVTDGDSLTVLTQQGELVSVRLYGVDAPEYRQKGGREATGFTDEAALFSQVSLSIIEKDQYGRSVALVHLPNGKTLNEELVREGHAWVYRRYCDMPQCLSWLALERQAKKQGLGLWQSRNPTPPWEWRRKNK